MCATGVPGAVGPGCGARPLCVPVGGGPPARSPHASLKARSGRSRGPPWPCRHPPAPRPGPPDPPVPSTPVGLGRCEYPCQAPPPPTGTAARPSGPSGLLHTCGDCVLACCSSPPNFACNSPPVVCLFVSVRTVTSLVFLNCMRFCLALALTPIRAQHPGSAVPRRPPRRRRLVRINFARNSPGAISGFES